jgi:hypothetical protein
VKVVILLLLAVCIGLAAALAEQVRINHRDAAQAQALAAEAGNVHAAVAVIAHRLHLAPAGTTALMLANISKQIGPRVLSAADSGAIANTLIPAGVFSFQVDVMSNDPETRAFAREIFNTLLLAGWTPEGPGPLENFTNGVADVAISAGTKKQYPAVYAKLVAAFAQAGIAMTDDKTGASYAPPGTVDILVGAKP